MRLVFGLVLLVGVGLAGFAVYMAQQYITANEQEMVAAQERAKQQVLDSLSEVYVTTKSVRYGDRLQKEDVKTILWPKEGIPEGAFTEEEALFPVGQPPRTVLRAMEKGEALLDVKLTDPGEDAGVGSKLAPGMRAFALRVDVASGVSGFLRPGDRVDIYWTGSNIQEEGGTREFTKLIQSAVQIIAIDQSADEDRNAPTVARTVTVEATPQEVGKLAQAQATGRLQLSLVGAQDDGQLAAGVEVTQTEIVGEVERVAPAPKKEVCTIRTRRGGEMVTTEIDCPTN